MALPSIKNATFTLRIKEFDKPLSIRPMIVAEHKAIQQVIDIGSENDIALTISEVTKSCTNGKVDAKSVPQYVLDFIFLQIYMTSVENVVSSTYTCYNYLKNEENGDILYDEETGDPILCDNNIDVKIPLSNANIIYPEKYEELRRIEVTKGVFLNLKNLALQQNIDISEMRNNIMSTVNRLTELDDADESPEVLKEIKDINKKLADIRAEIKDKYTFMSVESIDDNGKIMLPEVDFTAEEFKTWLDSCPSSVIADSEDFFESAPIVGMDIKITCPKCMNTSEVKLRGLKDFF